LIIGIDIGSTTTKVVSIEDGKITGKVKTKAPDAVTAATGAFGKILLENKIKMNVIRKIKITGAGASKIKDDIFGIPTGRVNEIDAIGIGGMFLSQMKNIIITNIGTGTAIIEAGEKGIFHLGGTGVGGGTIFGLAKKLLPTMELDGIMELAKEGLLNKVDLLLEDITDTDISFLKGESTASNFGKMLDSASCNDIALAIINMVYQVIGVMSVFAAKSKNTDSIVVTGNGSNNPIGQKILAGITEMYGVKFIYPEFPEFTTAAGAGLSKD
jgi:type II pantothenate kinase